MTDSGEGGSRFETRTTSDSHFSWVRTRLSLERTMMSWIRTSVALIGFGFTIVQFFDRIQHAPRLKPPLLPEAPRYFGLALILCGIVTLLVAVGQYRWSLRYLWNEDFASIAGASREGLPKPLYAVVIALLLVGTATFLGVLLRLT